MVKVLCALCKKTAERLYPIDYEAEQGNIHGKPIFVCPECYRKHEAA